MKKIFEKFESLNLGLLRNDQVELKACQLQWRMAFEIERARIYSELGDTDFALHHIGSTSIPSILAKPILDILMATSSLEAVDECKRQFADLGYEYKGEYGIPGRRYCVLYNPEKTKGFVHIHSFVAGSPQAVQHLLFRDYLVANPERAATYQEKKLDLLKKPGMTRSNYSESKADFIHQILQEAKEWQSRR